MKRKTALVAAAVLATSAIGTAVAQLSRTHHTHRHKLERLAESVRPLSNLELGQEFGKPLHDLTPQQQDAFEAGQEEFESIETIASGLGPIYNDNSCAACHSSTATGGAGTTHVTRFGRLAGGHFDDLSKVGGSLLQRFAIEPSLLEHIPQQANVVAFRQTTPLFGAGLIEAIPDDEIRQNALRHKPDGISGRVAMILDPATQQMHVGRFGWKAQHSNLLSFAGDAYLNEMGITNRFYPTENAPNGDEAKLEALHLPKGIEDTVNPETGRSDIDAAADFMRYLAPPPQARPNAEALVGRRLFEELSCAACHTPVMHTGPNKVEALSNRPVWLYSDLLLHNMGSLGDGIEQGAASGREMRTMPLWGLRARAPYLHDGRAKTVDEAIRDHAGEAIGARYRYEKLPPEDAKAILAFLRTL